VSPNPGFPSLVPLVLLMKRPPKGTTAAVH
jgi:hypothetical protein